METVNKTFQEIIEDESLKEDSIKLKKIGKRYDKALREYNVREDVRGWAREKGLNNPDFLLSQMEKVSEEVAELLEEVEEYSSSGENFKDLMMELGDVLVTVEILALQLGSYASDGLERAYLKIRDRDGKLINGSFVKAEDLR